MYKSYVPYLQHIHYMGVNYYIVWDVAKNIIPTLTGQIQNIIDTYGESESHG